MRISDWSSDVGSSDLRCPPALSVPSSSSVTLWEETAPVKLPTTHGPRPGLRAQVRTSSTTGWYFKDGSTAASATVSRPPTYPTQTNSTFSVRSEEHTSELQSLMRITYDVFSLKQKNKKTQN